MFIHRLIWLSVAVSCTYGTISNPSDLKCDIVTLASGDCQSLPPDIQGFFITRDPAAGQYPITFGLLESEEPTQKSFKGCFLFYEPPIGDVLFEYNLTKISNIDLKITLSYLGGEKKIEVTGTGPRYITTTVKIYSDSDQDKQFCVMWETEDEISERIEELVRINFFNVSPKNAADCP